MRPSVSPAARRGAVAFHEPGGLAGHVEGLDHPARRGCRRAGRARTARPSAMGRRGTRSRSQHVEDRVGVEQSRTRGCAMMAKGEPSRMDRRPATASTSPLVRITPAIGRVAQGRRRDEAAASPAAAGAQVGRGVDQEPVPSAVRAHRQRELAVLEPGRPRRRGRCRSRNSTAARRRLPRSPGRRGGAPPSPAPRQARAITCAWRRRTC